MNTAVCTDQPHTPPYHWDAQFNLFTRDAHGLGSINIPLLSVIQNCADRSCASAQLARRGAEAGFRYETDPLRVAVLGALQLPHGARILEIGTAGGTLTRYLGERGFSVVALEPAPAMAACAAERCRDLPNVVVYVDSVENFAPSDLFDLVVCVDPTFVGADSLNPIDSVAKRASDLLRPTGTLLLAAATMPLAVGDEFIVHNRDSVRGVQVPAALASQTLTQVGFRHVEEVATFPSHTAPRVLVHPTLAQQHSTDWHKAAIGSFDAPLSSFPYSVSWIRQSSTKGSIDDYAPGFLLLAHKHRVHVPLWQGWGGVQLSLEGTRGMESSPGERGLHSFVVPFNDASIARWIQYEGQPRLVSLSSHEAEIHSIKAEVSKALAKERETYALLAREELDLRSKYEVSKGRVEQLEGELSLAQVQIAQLATEIAVLNDGILCERKRGTELASELQGVRLQHQSIFKEMCRFKAAAEHALMRVQELECELLQRDASAAKLTEAILDESSKVETLVGEIKQMQRSRSWRLGRKVRAFFGLQRRIA